LISILKKWTGKQAGAVGRLGLPRGHSFDLDFHTIPLHGEDALIEKHYVSKRSRRQKGILAFLVQDAETRVFCYANGELRKNQQNDEILRFVRFWKERTGRYPEELIFDSKLTTYAKLNELNRLGIQFITLRRRSPGLVREIDQTPRSAWRRIELKGVSRKYKHPRILDGRIALAEPEVGRWREVPASFSKHQKGEMQWNRRTSKQPLVTILGWHKPTPGWSHITSHWATVSSPNSALKEWDARGWSTISSGSG